MHDSLIFPQIFDLGVQGHWQNSSTNPFQEPNMKCDLVIHPYKFVK